VQLPNGTYRGFTWTDESPSAMGEMKVVIDGTGLHLRIATGLKLITESVTLPEVRDLTTDEVVAHFKESSDTTDVVGVQIGHNGVVLLYLADPDKLLGLSDEEKEESRDAPRVVVRGMAGEEGFGPSYLYTPDQVEAGLFDRCLAAIQAELGQHAVPLIADGGLRTKAQG
jgi:hypothetical protein